MHSLLNSSLSQLPASRWPKIMHKFVIKRNGVLETYTQYEDIPDDFDHVIEFVPEIPDGPHSDEEHDELAKWNDRLQGLIRKEYARSNKNR